MLIDVGIMSTFRTTVKAWLLYILSWESEELRILMWRWGWVATMRWMFRQQDCLERAEQELLSKP